MCCVNNCGRVCALLRRSGTSYRQHASKTSQRNAEAVHAYSQASRKELCDPAPSNHVAVPTVRVQVARGGLWELPLKAGYVVPVFKVCPWGWVSKKNPTCAANSSTSAGPKERRAAPAPQGNKTYARIGEFQKPEFQKPELGAGGRQKHAGESFGGVDFTMFLAVCEKHQICPQALTRSQGMPYSLHPLPVLPTHAEPGNSVARIWGLTFH